MPRALYFCLMCAVFSSVASHGLAQSYPNKPIRLIVPFAPGGTSEVLARMIGRKVVEGEKIRRIYKSQTFPTTGYGHVYNLKPELAAKVKEAFFSFPWEGSKLKAEFKKEDKFVPITYQRHWAVIRKIDAANNVSYACK